MREADLLGQPLVFILIYWVVDIPLLDNLDFSGLSSKAQARLSVIGEAAFIRACYAMLAKRFALWFVLKFGITMTRNGILSIDEI